jgi:hypothetical protein
VDGERLHRRVSGGPWSYDSPGRGEPAGEDKAWLEKTTGASGAVIAGCGTYASPEAANERSPTASARTRIAGSLAVSSTQTAQNGGAAPARPGWQQVASTAGVTLSNRDVEENAHSPPIWRMCSDCGLGCFGGPDQGDLRVSTR